MIDTYEKLPTTLTKVEEIVHIADVHIRLTKRHDEYREVFAKVYAEIGKTSPNTLVIIAGDLFHSKVDLSPEAVQVASEFLKNCADLRPTIIIPGNHDCLLTNVTRLDSISPIIENLGHESLYYLKESKLYSFANLLFNNMSIFEDYTSFLKMSNVTKKILSEFDTKIALYHGGVFDAKTDIGYTITNKSITNNMFEGHDIAILGDIHLAQDLQKYDPSLDNPIIRYAGSLLQQNHGEALLGHGISLWNVKDRTYKHIEIPNDYGYFTIDIVDGKLVTDITGIPKKPKLRVRCKESVATEVKKVIAEIRKNCEITDLIYMRVEGDGAAKAAAVQAAANLQQITNVEYQNTLISGCLKAKYPEVMDDATIEAVHTINKTLNIDLSKDDQSRNIRWRPIKFEFSNMFSYGENNTIDFTKLEDVYGLFAANASGKSSLMDALCFTIFDKSARAFKASHVINSQKMSFSGRFTFEINGTTYVIERKGARDKKNNVKVDVNFYKIEENKNVSLNSEARRSTNEIIRDYLGSYDEFVLTSLALQGNQGSFIDMGQTERKELLSQFIGLNIFDSLYAKASDHLKEITGAIKMFNKEHNHERLESMKGDITLLESKLEDLKVQRDKHAAKKQEVDNEIKVHQEKIVTLENVPVSIVGIQKEKLTLTDKISDAKVNLTRIDPELTTKKAEQAELATKLAAYATLGLKEKAEKHSSLVRNQARLENEIEKLRTLVKEKLKKLEHLDKHEYDPNCTFCSNNIFVKDAIATRESLSKDKQEARELSDALANIKIEVGEYAPFVSQYQDSVALKERANNLSAQVSKKELDKVNLMTGIEKATARVAEIDAQIELYERSKEVIEANKAIDAVIQKLTVESNNLAAKLKSINKEYVDAYSRKVSLTDQQKNIEEQIAKIEACEVEEASYEYYLSAIGKDGVPFKIISDAMPKIEQEANNILSQIVEFTMSLETDGKNVNAYIKYEDRKWPLELCSGMEKFVAALALRVALINISNLPRANFLVVDEGFGALDASNMAMVHSLFDYLKTNFEFIVVISHLDAMRDMVDKQLEIKKENGFSKIDNTV
jgi:DNA repair exonuclease SbcCD ATPase subunit/DNA repair exonuclease SbcCD nuclease subunit